MGMANRAISIRQLLVPSLLAISQAGCTYKVAMPTTELIVSLQVWSCSDVDFTRRCLKKPTFARSCHESFPPSEFLVQRCRSVLNMSQALLQLLIATFDSWATVSPSDFHSGSFTACSDLRAMSTESRSSFRLSTAF